jgi:hypothetical protein
VQLNLLIHVCVYVYMWYVVCYHECCFSFSHLLCVHDTAGENGGREGGKEGGKEVGRGRRDGDGGVSETEHVRHGRR